MYNDASPELLKKNGNRGMTLYGLLSDDNNVVKEMRYGWRMELYRYDLIIISDILNLPDIYLQLSSDPKLLKKIVIIDAEDTSSLFPFMSVFTRLRFTPYHFLYNYKKVKYFKREFDSKAGWYNLNNFKFLNHLIPDCSNVFPISMSFPKKYINHSAKLSKTQDFVNINLDSDLVDLFGSYNQVGEWKPLFTCTGAYLSELDKSKFGITTKRAGWDCLRHYEYAARGVVLCFKDLDKKHLRCAPFGLNENNCIIYNSAVDLKDKLKNISDSEYLQLQNNSFKWIEEYSSENVAKRFLYRVF